MMIAFWKGIVGVGLEGRDVVGGHGGDDIPTDFNLNSLPNVSLPDKL